MRTLFAPLGLALLLTQPLLAAAPLAAAPPVLPRVDAPVPQSAAWTLDAALAMAFSNNPSLRAADLGLDMAAGQRTQAGLIPNPELSYLSEGTRQTGRTTTIQLNQVIEIGGQRSARIGLAERDSAVAAAERSNVRSELRANVIGAFFDVLVAQERLALALASQRLSQQVTEAAARRVSAGKISPVEETRARVAEAGTKVELSQAGSELAQAKRRLASTWGGTASEVNEVVAPPDAAFQHGSSADVLSHLGNAPQVEKARRELERHRAAANLERSRRVPDLTVSIGSKRDEQLAQRQTIVGLAIPLPFFDRNQGNLLSALRRADQASEQLRTVENRVSAELGQAALRLESAVAELRILRNDILPGAQSAYDAGTKGFELGKFGFLDVLDAQRTLFQAKTQYLRALGESHRAIADIERLVGTPTSHAGTPAAAAQQQDMQ